MAKEKIEDAIYDANEGKVTPVPAKAKYDFTNLNTLAVVSLASAVTGFGAAAAVITGHVSLAQIKKSNEAGRGLAIAGVAAGYTVIGLWILSTLGFVALSVWGARNGIPLGGFDDHMRGGFGFERGGDHGGDRGGFDMQPMPVPTEVTPNQG
jgi:hypothetical protein